MSKVMLIDAVYAEETRVAVIDNKNRLVEYDFETSSKKISKGNIYLAKVMRVEPSLQSAFVEYGGDRHGFLAFNEIHPDYFRIPVSDREALNAQLNDHVITEELETEEPLTAELSSEETESQDDGIILNFENTVSTIAGESVESIDDIDIAKNKRPSLHHLYKIQEVIHKNQILLVQVFKEERGQKGAAVTTYLSLAGRYSVLMPNSPRSGGISRKIINIEDRKRLRKILDSLNISDEMGLIIRTAGKDHTKAELKRDADYLLKLWEEIRQETLKAIAPALVYQEDNIIKRAIRDLYSSDVSDIFIEGSEEYKNGRDFLKKLMPSHVKKLKQFKNDQTSIFNHYKVEKQIEAMQSSIVQLPSGGSIVLQPTEALVSIDINSGRSTRERNIENTALNTNLEAAVEIARQVRLRDLAGIIVIDYIDMRERSNIQQVEKKTRDAFRDDRARVQMSKIGPFGLLELSRQRLRPSIHETSYASCIPCQGTGYIRSIESTAVQILRAITDEGTSGRSAKVKVQVPPLLARYLLNNRRNSLAELEKRHNFFISIEDDAQLIIPNYRMIQLQRKQKNNIESEIKDPSLNSIIKHNELHKKKPVKHKTNQNNLNQKQPSPQKPDTKTNSIVKKTNDKIVSQVSSPPAVSENIPAAETVKKSTLRNRNNRRRYKERRNALLNNERKNNEETNNEEKNNEGKNNEEKNKNILIPVIKIPEPNRDEATLLLSSESFCDHVKVNGEEENSNDSIDLNLKAEKPEFKKKRPLKKSWLKRLLEAE